MDQDRYGLSWQVMYAAEEDSHQRVIPTLMFVGEVCGKAEEAVAFYTSVFPESKLGHVLRYAKGEEPDREGTIKRAGFTLAGQEFAAMDSARDHSFGFNEAVSFMVGRETQDEIDYYWTAFRPCPRPSSAGGGFAPMAGLSGHCLAGIACYRRELSAASCGIYAGCVFVSSATTACMQGAVGGRRPPVASAMAVTCPTSPAYRGADGRRRSTRASPRLVRASDVG